MSGRDGLTNNAVEMSPGIPHSYAKVELFDSGLRTEVVRICDPSQVHHFLYNVAAQGHQYRVTVCTEYLAEVKAK